MHFGAWLDQQIGRDDPVGDLAADASKDRERPGPQAQYGEWLNYLRSKQACRDALDALKQARREYRQEVLPGKD